MSEPFIKYHKFVMFPRWMASGVSTNGQVDASKIRARAVYQNILLGIDKYIKNLYSLCKTHPFSTKYPLGYSYTFPVDSQQVNGRKVRAELDSSANSYTMGELISKEAG